MKTIAIDIGNSNIVCGEFLDRKLINKIRVETSKINTVDDWEKLFIQNNFNVQNSKVAVSSVVPQKDESVQEFLSLNSVKYFFVDFTNTDLIIKLDEPSEVGADRLAISVAGINKYKEDLIIVDFGTATTVEVVTKEREYEGGAIIPGINTSFDALISKAAKLKTIKIEKPDQYTGKTTKDALLSGIYYGYLHQITGIIDGIKREFLDRNFKIIITGGLSQIFKDEKFYDYFEPDLILYGLENECFRSTKPN